MQTNASVSIPKDILEPIIQAHVSSAIAAALGDQGRIVQAAVEAALNQKVDEQGKPSNWDTKTSFLQWLVRSAIREAATTAVREHLASDIENLKAVVAKEIKNQRSPLTKALIEGIAKSTVDSARFNIHVNVDGVAQRY